MPIDAYVLISHGDYNDTEGIGSSALGRWRGRAVGTFDAVIAIEDESLDGIRGQLGDIRRAAAGNIRTDTLFAVRPRPCQVKRTSLPDGWMMAFMLIDAAPHQTRNVLEDLRRMDPDHVAAAAIVTGSADLLVELHAEDFDGLLDHAELVGEIDGIRSTRTTFVQPSENSPNRPDGQAS